MVLEVDNRECPRTPARAIMAGIDETDCLRADGDFCRFVLTEGQSPFLCRLLGSFVAELPSPPILRLDGAAEPLNVGRAAAGRLRTALAG